MFLGPAWACPKVASDSGSDRGSCQVLRSIPAIPTGLTRNSLEMAEKVTKKQNYELQIQSQQAYYETASKWQKT